MLSRRLWLLAVVLVGCSSGGTKRAPGLRAAEPPSAAFLTEVTLHGAGFSPTPGENSVEFVTSGGERYPAGVVAASEDRLQILMPVPLAGYARVQVSTRGEKRGELPFQVLWTEDPPRPRPAPRSRRPTRSSRACSRA